MFMAALCLTSFFEFSSYFGVICVFVDLLSLLIKIFIKIYVKHFPVTCKNSYCEFKIYSP